MPGIDANTSLGGIVTENSARAAVLERYGLDYCCGGSRSLADACAGAGLAVEEVLVALLEAGEARGSCDAEVAGATPAALTHHILERHHAFLYDQLPRLDELAAKVAEVHGENHPELRQVRAVSGRLAHELMVHMAKEEQILFPAIRGLEDPDEMPVHGCGTLASPIRVMLMEHDDAGAALSELHRLTDGYRVPPDACPSYTMMLQGLAALETDVHLHIHEENNILFPAALAQDSEFTQG